MARTFHLRLLLAGQEDLVCEVRNAEAERLKTILGADSSRLTFFWFDTIDGRSIIVNLNYLQGVRYLWDVAAAPPDSRVNEDEGMNIALVGREVISEVPSEDPKEMYTLFWLLELGGDAHVTFIDVDGEDFTLVARQIVYLAVPKQVMDDGRREVAEQDGLT